MISYPPPIFEQQRTEVLQRYRVLRGDQAHDAACLADLVAASLKVKFVHVGLYKRYRARYQCSRGFSDYPTDDVETYFARMHLSQGLFQTDDIDTEEYFQSETYGLTLPDFKSLAGIPLTDPHGKRFGTLCIAAEDNRTFDPDELNLLSSFAHVVSNDICVRSAAHYAVEDLLQLEREKCELFELATIDPLTNALNRRSFERFANREIARMKRDQVQLSTLMLDLDHFKDVNDKHGHAVGDQVIAKFVSVITKCVRQEDLVGRLGGEEFAVVLIETNVSDAEIVAKRIGNTIKQFEFPGVTGPFSITCSIGISEPTIEDESIASSISRADEALYIAKQTGRDRTVIKHAGPKYPYFNDQDRAPKQADRPSA